MRNLFMFFVMGPEGAAGAGGGAPAGAGGAAGGASSGGSPGGQGGEGQGAEGGGSPAGGTPAPKTPAQRHKLKVDNQEEEVEYEELVRRAQIGTHAHKRINMAAQTEKRFNGFMDRVKTPAGLLALADELGYKPEDLRTAMETEYKRRFMDPETMTPEQKELQKYKEKEKRELEEKKNQEVAERDRQREMVKQHHKKQFGELIKSALTEFQVANPDSDIDEEMVMLAAREIYLNRKAKLPVDVKAVAQALEKKLAKQHRAFYKNASLATLQRVLGDDTLKRFLKLSIEWHKTNSQPRAQPTPDQGDPAAAQPQQEKKSNGYIKMGDWQKNRGK